MEEGETRRAESEGTTQRSRLCWPALRNNEEPLVERYHDGGSVDLSPSLCSLPRMHRTNDDECLARDAAVAQSSRKGSRPGNLEGSGDRVSARRGNPRGKGKYR